MVGMGSALSRARVGLFIGFLACCTAAAQASLVNLALGKPTSASSFYNSGESFPSAAIVDGRVLDGSFHDSGNNWSFWLSSNQTTAGQWVQVDLQATHLLGSVTVIDTHNREYRDRGTKDFHIEISTDGNAFSTVAAGSFSYTQWEGQTPVSLALPAGTAGRFVRFSVDSVWPIVPQDPHQFGAGLSELQVFEATGSSAVPEPSSSALALLAGAGLMAARRRRGSVLEATLHA